MDPRRTIGTAQQSRRADSADRGTFEALCEEALDYYESGDAQRRWLRAHLIHRYGETPDPRKAVSTSTDVVVEVATAETDGARQIREDRMELITVPLVRSIVDSVAVLYSADDLERVYRDGDNPDPETARTIARYHDAAGLPSLLQQIDAYVALLQSCLLLVRWCGPRKRIDYSIVFPHSVRLLSHPEWPLDPSLAYGIAYRETPAAQGDGAAWCCYLRSPLDIDPDDAPTQGHEQGRLVRFRAKGEPWPALAAIDAGAEGDSGEVLDDGPNPLVEIGGMKGGRLLWSPLVWHWGRPPVESVHPHPSADLVAANREVDLGLSWLQYLANTQSHGQAVITGGGAVPQALGPSSVVRVDDPAGGFDYVAPSADLSGLLEVVQRQMQVQALLRHLSPDMYSLTRPSIQTGPAKLIEQHALIEARWRRCPMADRWESARFELERLLHNEYGRDAGRKIPESTTQLVRWGELRVPVDRSAQVTRLIAEIGAGITSRVDAAMEVYGLDRDAAEEHLRTVDGAAAPAVDVVAPAAEVEPTSVDALAPPTGADEPAAPVEAEPVEAEPAGAALSEDERKGLEFVGRMFETLVKAKSPPEVSRALMRQMAERLGIADDAVEQAINDAEFEWYTTPPPEEVAGGEAPKDTDA